MMAFGLNTNDNQIQETKTKYEPNYFLMASGIL